MDPLLLRVLTNLSELLRVELIMGFPGLRAFLTSLVRGRLSDLAGGGGTSIFLALRRQ